MIITKKRTIFVKILHINLKLIFILGYFESLKINTLVYKNLVKIFQA